MACGQGHGKEHSKLRRQAEKHAPKHCNNNPNHPGPYELDHIINLKAGGTNTLDNTQWLCKPCHMHKTQQEATKARNKWKRQPEQHPGRK